MGQEVLTDNQKYFLQKAQENFPKIYYKTITSPEKTNLNSGDSFVLDLGNHYVGKFSFKMDNVNVFIDAPTKLIVKFCEDMREVEIERGADTFYEVYVPSDSEFSPYGDRMNNSLCHAWSCTPSYFIRKYNL